MYDSDVEPTFETIVFNSEDQMGFRKYFPKAKHKEILISKSTKSLFLAS